MSSSHNKKQHVTWLWVFVLSSILFLSTWMVQPLLLHLGHWDLLKWRSSHRTIQATTFDTRAAGPLAVPQIFNLTHPKTGSNNENLTLQFNFKYYSLKDLEDLFQTGVANEGIRVESDQKGDLVIVVGADNAAGYVSSIITHVFYPLFFSIAPNTWHTLRINAWNRHSVVVWLDGMRVANLQDPAIQYHVTETKVGRGFGELRPFDGVIKNFELTQSWFSPIFDKILQQSLTIIAILTFILSVFSFSKCLPAVLSREEKINWLALLSMLGFIAIVTYNFIAAVYFGKGYPYNSFLFLPETPFSDYYLLPILNEGLHPYSGAVAYAAIYFPFTYLLTYPAVWWPHGYLILMNLSFVMAMFLFVRHYFSLAAINSMMKLINAKNIFILAFLTYPFLCAFERGNTEVILFIMVALSIYWYQRHDFYKSAFMIGMAAAMKLFPLLLVTLFLSEKKYKPALFSGIVFLALTGFALCCLQGGFYQNLTAFLTALHNTNQTYSFLPVPRGMPGCWPSVEILSFIKSIYFHIYHTMLSVRVVKIYQLAIAAFSLLLVIYVICFKDAFWKKLMLLICAMLLFPILSFQYKLVYVYLPLALFVNEKNKSTREDSFYLVLFALIMVPTNYFYLKSGSFSLSTLIDSSALMVMMVSILARGLYLQYQRYFLTEKKIVPNTAFVNEAI